jgi:hypothetical protein
MRLGKFIAFLKLLRMHIVDLFMAVLNLTFLVPFFELSFNFLVADSLLLFISHSVAIGTTSVMVSPRLFPTVWFWMAMLLLHLL